MRKGPGNLQVYRLSKRKDAEVRRVYRHAPSSPSAASRRGKLAFVWSHVMGTNQLNVVSDGMACFSIRTHFKILDSATNLATPALPVHLLRLDPNTSLSSTPPVPISSPLTIAIAATSLRKIGHSYYAKNGVQQPSLARKPFLLSIASKHSTNLLCKARLVYMTTTTHCCDDLIMLAFPILL